MYRNVLAYCRFVVRLGTLRSKIEQACLTSLFPLFSHLWAVPTSPAAFRSFPSKQSATATSGTQCPVDIPVLPRSYSVPACALLQWLLARFRRTTPHSRYRGVLSCCSTAANAESSSLHTLHPTAALGSSIAAERPPLLALEKRADFASVVACDSYYRLLPSTSQLQTSLQRYLYHPTTTPTTGYLEDTTSCQSLRAAFKSDITILMRESVLPKTSSLARPWRSRRS